MLREDLFKNLTAHCKEYGFIFPSSELYDGLAAVYDYGQNGVELKLNIRQYWWEAMTRLHQNIVGLDSAIFMHPKIWEASGHLSAFNDPLIDNKDSKKRYRADVLVEDWIAKQEEKLEKEVGKAAKRFGEAFDRAQFVHTNARALELQQSIDSTRARLANLLTSNDLAGLKQLIEELEIVCPISGTRNWTDVRQFNLMFATRLGSVSEEANEIYLRPETAQGIFVNFLNVQKTGRMRIPFGIAQVGKAFRNEIVARQFTFRMREFEQMEMQYFVAPGNEMEWFEYWKEARLQWHLADGIVYPRYPSPRSGRQCVAVGHGEWPRRVLASRLCGLAGVWPPSQGRGPGEGVALCEYPPFHRHSRGVPHRSRPRAPSKSCGQAL